MNCPKCGALVREGATFCNHCGAPLKTSPEIPQGDATKPVWLRRVYELKWIILAYLIASVLCMSCACLLGYRTQWILWKLGLW
ncbi:MAG: zinc ribbon domain-containing protein [Anaerolineae bacterium]|nr:zinc ribbon domain-containing protein [Anaerolineae bacterium]